MTGKRLFTLAFKGLLEEKQNLEFLKSYYPDEPLYDKKLNKIQLEINEITEKLNKLY